VNVAPVQEINVPFINGFAAVSNHKNSYYKNQFGEVALIFSVKRADNSTFSGIHVVANIPVVFRPNIATNIPMASAFPNNSYALIDSSGNLTVSTSGIQMPSMAGAIIYRAP